MSVSHYRDLGLLLDSLWPSQITDCVRGTDISECIRTAFTQGYEVVQVKTALPSFDACRSWKGQVYRRVAQIANCSVNCQNFLGCVGRGFDILFSGSSVSGIDFSDLWLSCLVSADVVSHLFWVLGLPLFYLSIVAHPAPLPKSSATIDGVNLKIFVRFWVQFAAGPALDQDLRLRFRVSHVSHLTSARLAQ